MTRDIRNYAKQTNVRLIVGFILILFIVGDGLIYIFLGRRAAIMGIICLMAALLPVMMVLIALVLIDWIARRRDND